MQFSKVQGEKNLFGRPGGIRRGIPYCPGSVLLGALVLIVTASGSAYGSGELTQLPGTDGCVSETGTGGECADGRALQDAHSVVVSRDGKNVYATSIVSDAVAIFSREK